MASGFMQPESKKISTENVPVKIKAAVFDVDGLMFDTERLAMAAWDYAGEKMGLGKTGYMVMKTSA